MRPSVRSRSWWQDRAAGCCRRPARRWEIDDATRAELLASAAVFVAPHRERESFGIVVLEAMASGVPVVASDIAPFVDLLAAADQPLGSLFAAGDPVALADAVIEALTCPEPQRQDAARTAAARYDWSEVGEAVTAVYAATLAGEGDRGPVEGTRGAWPTMREARRQRIRVAP